MVCRPAKYKTLRENSGCRVAPMPDASRGSTRRYSRAHLPAAPGCHGRAACGRLSGPASCKTRIRSARAPHAPDRRPAAFRSRSVASAWRLSSSGWERRAVASAGMAGSHQAFPLSKADLQSADRRHTDTSNRQSSMVNRPQDRTFATGMPPATWCVASPAAARGRQEG